MSLTSPRPTDKALSSATRLSQHCRHLVVICLVLSPAAACTTKSNKPDRAQRQQIPSGDSAKAAPTPTDDARGGVIDGNGGELITNEHNPWFVGDAAVPYCVITSPDFSASPATASQTITAALANWTQLLKDVNGLDGGSSRNFKILGISGSLRLATTFTEVDCTTDPPLRFKFGVTDSDVTTSLRYSARSTVGFARRTAYSDDTGRSRGYIWLAPDRNSQRYPGPSVAPDFWSHPHVLHNVLMHELGHTFGIPHFPKSFMDATAPAAIVASGLDVAWSGQDLRLTNILLFSSPFCAQVLDGKSLPPEDAAASSAALAAFLAATWGITSPATEICAQLRNDLAKPGENTPVMLTLKAGQSVLAASLVATDGYYSDTMRITGRYLTQKDGAADAYEATEFFYLDKHASILGSFSEPSGGRRFVSLEMPSPGVLLIKAPVDGQWSTLAAISSSYAADLNKLSRTLDALAKDDNL